MKHLLSKQSETFICKYDTIEVRSNKRMKTIALKCFSDLDICFKGAIAPEVFELLKEAFENSELPFKVDLVEYSKISKTFQQIIDQQGIDIRLL